MPFVRPLTLLTVASALSLIAVSPTSHAQSRPEGQAQICTLGSAAVGQFGTLICKDVLSGATTQTIPLGLPASAAGGIAASLATRDDRVLVTNQASGAVLFHL